LVIIQISHRKSAVFDEAAKRRNFQFLLALWCALLGSGISFAGHFFLVLPRLDHYFAAIPLQSVIKVQLLIILQAISCGAIIGGWVGWRIAPWLATRRYRYWVLAVLPSLALVAGIAPSLEASPHGAVPHNSMMVPQGIGVSIFTLGIPFLLRHRGVI
jgi:hypothetical protein